MEQNYTSVRTTCLFTFAFFLFYLFRSTTALAQSITVETGRYQIDNTLKLIVCNKVPQFPAGQQFPTLYFDKDYTFSQSVSAFEIGKPYKVKTGTTTFTLYFTNFPLVNIKTQGNQTISTTDDRTKGTFTLANGTDPLFTSNMGIRIRGNASRKFPKKSYNMELWKDPDGNEELETSLLNLREDSKWYLLAMYNEPLRLNNVTSYAIWQNTHKLYYAAQEPDANPAIRPKYCDVFVNNSYFGVYLFTEPMDRKQLKLKKSGSNGEVRGELYKSGGWSGATTFKDVPPPPANPTAEVWAEWEMDYPDPYWTNLYDLVKYVVNSPADDFKTNVSKKLKIDNLIDYFIFLNVVSASDNNGNNQFLARYKEGEAYFFIPWDLDATFGYSTLFTRTDEARGFLTNGLLDRLITLDPGGFKSKMRKRWFSLRQNEYALQNLKNKLSSNYDLLTSEGGYARETTKWAGTVNTGDLPKVYSWLENRLNFLDEYFALFPENGPGIDLNYFHGEVEGAGKNLAWSTLQEAGAKQFEVEFSTDGVNFSQVATVPATGDEGSGQTYNFTHNNASPLAFYRLKIVTDNNQFTYTSYIQVGTNSCPDAPDAPTISKNLSDITEGQTAVLTASGCSETVVWSTGQTGFSVVVKPEVTTVYTAKCRQTAGCESPPSVPVQINVFQNGSLPGNFEGYLGGIDCTFLRGWAWDKKKPNAGIYVEVLDNQDVIGTVIADDFRQDLKDAGKGNGAHGFTFSIPETLKDNTQHNIGIRVLGSTFILRDSPKKLTCPRPANQAPIKPPVSPLSATVNAPFTATLPAFFDADSPTLTYTLTGLPNGLDFAADTRTITGTPTAKAVLNLTYKASDGQSSTSVVIVLTIKDAPAPPANLPPVKPAVSPLSATVNAAFTATLPVFTDPESAPLTYSLAGLPNELNFEANTRTITGTPTATATLSLTYTASDGPNSSSMVVTLKIIDPAAPPANLPPVKPPVSPLSATVTVAFTATLPAFTDPESAPLTYSLTGLPNELNFVAGTRTITGTPTATTTLSLTYTASDGPNSSFVTIPFTVVNKSTPPPLVTGNFEGYLDKVECGTIRGWVWDRNKPNTPLIVEFFANGQSIGTANADIFRQDIKNAGKGNGNHVYNFTTPQSVKTGQSFSISAKVQNSTYTLKDAPKNLTCAPNSRLGTSADEAVSGDLIITPNPTNGEFEVIFHTATQATSELSVVDELGRSWYRKTVEGVGLQRHKVLLSGARGTFIVGVRQGQHMRSKKILVVR